MFRLEGLTMLESLFGHMRVGGSARPGLTILLAAVAATCAASCGSEDNGSDDPPSPVAATQDETSGQTSPQDAARTGSLDDQIRYVIKRIQDTYVAGDATGFCSTLTAAGRKQYADVAKEFGHGSTCEEYVTVTSAMTRKAKVKQKPTVLIAVHRKGDRAIATVRDGGRPPMPMIFVKRDGEWKLPDPGIKAALAGGTEKSPPVSQTTGS
jgi:hypothetical protein